jgi:AcrR family transcriptional regulator
VTVAAAPLDRRAAILEAALSTFLERGVANASVEQICERAGASVGSVYHHFGDKGGLAGAVYLEALRDYQATFLAVLHAAPDDAEAAVRAAVEAHLAWCLRKRPELARFLFFYGDAARDARPEALAQLNRDFFAEVLRWWRPHAHYGAVRDVELDLAYALWLGPVQEYCRLRLSGRTTLAPARALGTLADAAWQSVRATGEDS